MTVQQSLRLLQTLQLNQEPAWASIGHCYTQDKNGYKIQLI